jgi:hypothetical protein
MKQDLCNLSATASKVGVPVNWLKEKATAQEIPCLKIKNRLLFNIEAVKATLLEIAARGGQ